VAKFTPSQALSYSKTYIVTILGGPSGVRDSMGNWFVGIITGLWRQIKTTTHSSSQPM
jgi:hypothetical protein